MSREELFRGNCPGEKNLGVIAQGDFIERMPRG